MEQSTFHISELFSRIVAPPPPPATPAGGTGVTGEIRNPLPYPPIVDESLWNSVRKLWNCGTGDVELANATTTNVLEEQLHSNMDPSFPAGVDDLGIGPLDFVDLIAQLQELYIDLDGGFAKGTYWSGKVEFVDLEDSQEEELPGYNKWESALVSTIGHPVSSTRPTTPTPTYVPLGRNTDYEFNQSGSGIHGPNTLELESCILPATSLMLLRDLDVNNCSVAENGEPSCLQRAIRNRSSLYLSGFSLCESCDDLKSFLQELAQQPVDTEAQQPEETNLLVPALTYEKRRGCGFCANGKQNPEIYTSHCLRVDGVLTCPLLRGIVCKICGATGNNAHTIAYCPAIETRRRTE